MSNEWEQRQRDCAVLYERNAQMGSPKSLAENAVVVRCSTYRGSLGPAFNWESSEYPYAQLTIALPEGREDLQEKLAGEMRELADRFIKENGLEPRER